MTVTYKAFKFLILIGLWKGVFNADLEEFSMNRNCDGTLELALERTYSAILSFDQWLQVSADKCNYAIQAYTSQDSLMFYFESFDVDCENGHLEVAYSIDQNFLDSKSVLGLTGAVCGNKPGNVYVAPARFLRLTYQPASGSLAGRVSFKIILTIFQNGPCDSLDFTCANGRCINKELKCNGYNPCGDESDCPADSLPEDLTTAAIITCVVALVAFVLCGLCVCYMFDKHDSGRSMSECPEDTCECVGGLCGLICKCCSKGCSKIGDCCVCTAECTARMARGICHTCYECGSSARTKCATICERTTEPTESPEEEPALPQTVSTEIQTDAAIQTDRADDTEERTNIASAPPLEADDTGQPPSYEAATEKNLPKTEAAPPSYDVAMKMLKH